MRGRNWGLSHLKEFIFHAITSRDPISSPFPTTSSGALDPIPTFISYDKFYASYQVFQVAITSHDEPKSFSHVASQPKWRDAMTKAIRALENNKT